MRTLCTLMFLLALGSCSAPPKPPAVDGSHRRPANAAGEIDLQSCRSELQNERILANDRTRDVAGLRARLAAFLTPRASSTASQDPRSTVYTVLFPYGATSIALPKSELELLVNRAQAAPLIVLSGRTDGAADSLPETRIARGRAEFVRDLLVRSGIPAARIRTTWQPTGDHVADNSSPLGRSLNRRVEIEIYPAAPKVGQPAPVAAA